MSIIVYHLYFNYLSIFYLLFIYLIQIQIRQAVRFVYNTNKINTDKICERKKFIINLRK